MARIYPPKSVAVISLVLILALSWVTGIVAQSSEAVVTLTEIKSQAFPQVTVSVAVADENGPRDGLTAANFRVSEDGVEVPATSITVASDVSQEVYLVLALDLSMKADSLAKLKEAAKSFVGILEPRNRVAVIAFYDEVKIVLDFTNNQEVLRTAIDNLNAEGDYTALNDAAFEAVTRVGELAGRKAVIMLTNSADNISTHSVDEVIDKAQSVRAPIYIIGFDRVKSDVAETITTKTGGKPFILPNLGEVQNSLQTIGQLLEQGSYKVTFRSGLKADNTEHNLVIGVTYEGKEGKVEGRFVTVPGQVTVSLPGLAEGQTVGGMVNLAMQATAPAPIASVEYWLNDRSLAKVTTPPYNFEWDSSSVEPGTYHLTVHAVDQAGNKGQVELNLNIVRPVEVTASTDRTEVQLGDRVTVVAKVEAPTEIAEVEFLLDGERIGSDDTPPYRFSFASEDYTIGRHDITVRARDNLGREAETSLAIRFLTPSGIKALWLKLGRYRWLAVGGGIVTTFAALAVFVIGFVVIGKVQERLRRKVYRLEISNLGNVRSRYELRAVESTGALRFQFTLHGVKLPERSVSWVTETPAGAGEVPAAYPAPASPPAGPNGEVVQPPTSGVGQTASQAMSTGNAISDLILSISSILPHSLATPLQRVVRPVYQAQSTVSRTRTSVGRVQDTASRVSNPPGQAAGTKPVSSPATQHAPPATPHATRTPQHAISTEQWVETPSVTPGESLWLDLIITPLNPYQTGHYSFKMHSRAIEQENAPFLVEEGSVQIVGTSWLRRFLPHLIFSVVALVTVALAVGFLLMSLGIVGG